jgi:hypothetical protein
MPIGFVYFRNLGETVLVYFWMTGTWWDDAGGCCRGHVAWHGLLQK